MRATRDVFDFDDAQCVQLSFIYRKAYRNAIIAHKNIIRSMQRSSVPPAVLLVSINLHSTYLLRAPGNAPTPAFSRCLSASTVCALTKLLCTVPSVPPIMVHEGRRLESSIAGTGSHT